MTTRRQQAATPTDISHRRPVVQLAATLVRGMAALAVVVVIVAGLPLVLLRVQPRMHLGAPTWDTVAGVLSRPDDGTLLLAALAVLAWTGWAMFTLAVLLEAASVTRRLPTPRLPLLSLPQAAAAGLVAAIVVMLLPTTRAPAPPPRPDITLTLTRTVVPDAPLDPGLDRAATAAQGHGGRDAASVATAIDTSGPRDATTLAAARPASEPGTGTVSVKEGDTLWDLAEHHLGDGRRYPEIAGLNYGRPQPDGHTLTDSHWLHPGWNLLIPDTHRTSPPTESGKDRECEVRPGDTLWHIAETQLGDGDRYPEIVHLNRHHPQLDGRSLTDPDVIQPGWILRLPSAETVEQPVNHDTDPTRGRPTGQPRVPATSADPVHPAHDRSNHASPAHAPTPPTSLTGAPTPAPAPGQGGQDHDPATPPEPSTQPVGPVTSVPPVVPSSPSQALPTTTPTPDPARPREHASEHRVHDNGIVVPGGYLPWSLVAAVTAAAAMAWLQRRRRHTLTAALDDPTSLDPAPDDEFTDPDLVRDIIRDSRRHPGHRSPTDLAERAAAVPPQHHPAPGGTGLTGDGADAAARAAMVTALSSGGPREPDHRAEVVTDTPTLTRLLTPGPTADRPAADPSGGSADRLAELGGWPRLHIADTPDQALDLLNAHLLHRSRILDDNTAPDLDTLRDQAPDEEPLPPLLLITHTPPRELATRTRTTLSLGTAMGITALLLGSWNDGPTLHIAATGHLRPTPQDQGDAQADDDPTDRNDADDAAADDGAERIAVLDVPATWTLLHTLREAHTGQRPAPEHRPAPAPDPLQPGSADPAAIPIPGPPRPPAASTVAAAQPQATALPVSAEDVEDGDPVAHPAAAAGPRADLRVLGDPAVLNATAEGRPLRAKAAELAVYLACHPGGADTRTIGEHLEPDSRLRQADQHVHNNVSNLRHVLGRAAGFTRNAHVTKTQGRYRLDPATVDVDLWHLHDLLHQAGLVTDPSTREQLLRLACDLYTAPLAGDHDYDWIAPHRERARRRVIHAHRQLADLLLPTQPGQAATVLGHAVTIDPYNEQLYQHAIRAHSAAGDRDGIHRTHRALIAALADLDAEPGDTTETLVAELLKITHPL